MVTRRLETTDFVAPVGEDACAAVLVEIQGRQTVSFIQGWRLVREV